MFHIDRKRLLDAVSRVGVAASKQYSAIPAMEGILFSHAEHGVLRLEATNGEQRVEQKVYTHRSESFERLAHAKSVADALKAQTTTFVDVGPDGPGLRVGDVTVPGLKLADWPKQPVGGVMIGKLRAPSFLDCIARAALAMSKDTYRPTLNGMSVSGDVGMMRLVATDSFWLTVIEVPHASIQADDPLILPAGAVACLIKLLKGEEGGVTLTLSKARPNEKASLWTWLWFRHARWTFCTRLVDGQFPNWQQLVPEEDQGYALDVNVEELREVVEAARKLKAERMELRLNGEITVEAKGAMAAVDRMIPGVYTGPDPLELSLSPELLYRALKAVPSPKIRVQADMKPVVLRGKGATALVMPIRMPVRPDDDGGAEMPPPPPAISDNGTGTRYQLNDKGYLEPVETDGDAEEEALAEVIEHMSEEGVADDGEEELTYIGSHAFREAGWNPDLGADVWECCTCEEFVTWIEVTDTHRCWLPAKEES